MRASDADERRGDRDEQDRGSAMAEPESAPTSATVTAEIGDAVRPCCAAITLTESGRSGRMPALRDTSAMIGSSA